MSGVQTRLIGISVFLAAFGGLLTAAPRLSANTKDENWMAAHLPDKVGKMTWLESNVPGQTYRMDKSTYDALKPFGIVCRLYQDNQKSYDVVLIASRSKVSFHDPRSCFTSQGSVLENQHMAFVDSPTRGKVPVTFTTLNNNGDKKLAAFTYRGPGGKFHDTTQSLLFSMFSSQLLLKKDQDGVFYRFIAKDTDTTEEEMKTFISKFLEASNSSSAGYF